MCVSRKIMVDISICLKIIKISVNIEFFYRLYVFIKVKMHIRAKWVSKITLFLCKILFTLSHFIAPLEFTTIAK